MFLTVLILAAVPAAAGKLLNDDCVSCHEAATTKGDVRLDNLGELPLGALLDLMSRMLEQVYLAQMPPTKKSQPAEVERGQLAHWLSTELRVHKASKQEDKLRYPSYGNYADHDQFFGGKIKDPPPTSAQRWLVSPRICEQRVFDVFRLEGKERERALNGVTNPFFLPDASGVRDYANTLLDGGNLLVMLANAEWISSKQIRPARVKNGELGEKEFSDPKDRWSPKNTPPAFEAINLKKDLDRRMRK